LADTEYLVFNQN